MSLIREIQVKTTMSCHLTVIRMVAIKNKKIKVTSLQEHEEIRTLYTVGRNVNFFSCYGKQYETSSKIKNRTTTYISNNLASVCIYPKELQW